MALKRQPTFLISCLLSPQKHTRGPHKEMDSTRLNLVSRQWQDVRHGRAIFVATTATRAENKLSCTHQQINLGQGRAPDPGLPLIPTRIFEDLTPIREPPQGSAGYSPGQEDSRKDNHHMFF